MKSLEVIRVNDHGRQHIQSWLIEHHKLWQANPEQLTEDRIDAYVRTAEDWAEMHPESCPQFEIRAWDCVRGYTMTCSIGEDGQEVSFVEVDEDD